MTSSLTAFIFKCIMKALPFLGILGFSHLIDYLKEALAANM